MEKFKQHFDAFKFRFKSQRAEWTLNKIEKTFNRTFAW